MTAKVHSTALVEEGARLGAGVEIGPFCHVGPRAMLDEGVRLVSHVAIRGVTHVGARTVAHPGVVLGGEGQVRGSTFAGGRLEIGPDCVLREMVSMNAGSEKGGGLTTVGARGFFMANSHVGHDCHVGDDVTFANSVALGGHVTIEDRVIIGGLAAVQQFCRVGRGAMVGGVTGVNRDIIPYAMAFGAHVELAGLNLIGLKRRGLSRDTINALRAAFRAIFYGKDGALPDRARAAAERWPDVAEIGEIVTFILAEAHQPLCHRAAPRGHGMSILGIIAGDGDLPRAVAESARAAGREIFIVALRGSVSGKWPEEFAHEWVSMGEPGRALKAMAAAGVNEMLLAGRVDRVKFAELKLDAKGVMMLPKVLAAARKGDDALLRLMVDMFEKEGFRAVTVPDAAPGLVCELGPLGRLMPNDDHKADIAQAFQIVRALGALDVGQAAAVCEGLALAVEAAEGTDKMIARIATLREALRGTPEKKRGVLVKALKPTQDAKSDMPVIGVETVRGAAAVGLSGIALEAGKSLIVGKAAVAEEADRLGLFVVGMTP